MFSCSHVSEHSTPKCDALQSFSALTLHMDWGYIPNVLTILNLLNPHIILLSKVANSIRLHEVADSILQF